MPQEVDDVEIEFCREIAELTLAEAFLDFKSLNTRQFLKKVQEVYALAQLQASDAELAMKVLRSTRARFHREIRAETMPAVAEQVAMLWAKSRAPQIIACNAPRNRAQQSSWLQNAKLQAILMAYFDESVSTRDFDDKSRRENANFLKAALMCSRLCLSRALKQVQAMERTSDVSTIQADNSGGIQPAPVKLVIAEHSVIEIFNPKFEPTVGDILINNDSAMWCGCGKDPPVADEGTQRQGTNAARNLGERTATMTVLAPSSSDEARGSMATYSSCHNIDKEQRRRPRIMSKPDHQSAISGG